MKADISRFLKDKILVMVIGPSAIGKSSLMNHVVSHDEAFARVSGFTTRQPRANDEPGLYRYLSEDEARSLIQNDACVQYAVYPGAGTIYGTQPQDYPGRYNLKDTLTKAVAPFRKLPFARAEAISLTVPADTWKRWFRQRYPHESEEALKRLQEARLSVEWSLAQTDRHYWLINHEGMLDQTAERLIGIVKGDQEGDDGQMHAEAILQLIERGIWT